MFHLLPLLSITAFATEPTSAPAESTGLAAIKAQAVAAEPLVKTDLARQFLKAADNLPAIHPRQLMVDPKSRRYYADAEARALPRSRRNELKPVSADEDLYYNTKYGTPLAYARPLEILAENGLKSVAGKKILDYGYGGIGHLRLLAALGADCTGVDVDPFLPALYSDPSDQGPVKAISGSDGRVTLINGHWPGDLAAYKSVATGYDVFISKNTLKNGYVHPASPVDKRMLIDLGCTDQRFIFAIHAALKPGGLAIIYNICPAPTPPGKDYKPWSDGRCPFPRKMWEESGFRVIDFDRDDSETLRKFAHAFGWDAGDHPMDIEKDLYAHFTVMERLK